MAEKKKGRIQDHSGTLFVGCIVLGLGIGLLLDHAGVGVLIGLGVGFIVMGLFKMITGVTSVTRDKEEKS